MSNPLFDIKALLQQQPDPGTGIFQSIASTADQSGCSYTPFARVINAMWQQQCTLMHFVNKGSWSMHEMLIESLRWTGQADVYICSYAMSETAARALATLKDSGQIRRLTCIIDNRVDVRTAGSLQLLRGICDSITLCDCHAKVTLLQGVNADITIVGSANYTENKRYETGIITSERNMLLFHKNWMEDAIREHGQYRP